MSAQYRPYRDEEDVPPEERAWVDDGPSGRIQIYEKTTHDIHHVVTQRHLLMGGCTIASIAAIIGVCVGYFAHTEHTVCSRGRSVALFSVYDEDPLVKDKILTMVSAEEFAHHVDLLGKRSLLDDHIVEIIKSEWEKAGLDEPEIDEFTASVTSQGDKANTIEILYSNGTFGEKFELSVTPDEFIFVGNSINKSITGPLVYASKLHTKDVKYLAPKNFTKGAILLVRYGVAPLHQHIIQAASLGAAGLLLYQDKADYTSQYDPAAFPRISISKRNGWPASSVDDVDVSSSVKNLVVQTISGNIAERLLKALESSDLAARGRMNGLLNASYKIGPSNFTLRVSTYQKTGPEKLKNVFGIIRGRVEPDRYVILGAGRDSWSPLNVGGLASLQELARVFGKLKKQGWRPRRSIIFCSFAAEHMGSVGLNHFLTNRLSVLRGRAVAYVDVTNPIFGFKSVLATGSPLLSQALFNATYLVNSANSDNNSTTVYDEWLEAFGFNKSNDAIRGLAELARKTGETDDSRSPEFDFLLGSNLAKNNKTISLFHNYLHSTLIAKRPFLRSLDYTDGFSTFLTEAGIPVIQIAYVDTEFVDNRRMDAKPYWFRTQFDSLNKVHATSDVKYKHPIAVIKVVAEVVRDLVDSLFVPFNLMEYAVTMESYTTTASEQFSRLFPDPRVDFGPVTDAVRNFTRAAVEFHQSQSQLDLRDPMAIRLVNDQLVFLERAFVYTLANKKPKHAFLEPAEAYPQLANVIPSVLDLITTSLGNSDVLDHDIQMQAIVEELTRVVKDATDLIGDVSLFKRRNDL